MGTLQTIIYGEFWGNTKYKRVHNNTNIRNERHYKVIKNIRLEKTNQLRTKGSGVRIAPGSPNRVLSIKGLGFDA